MRIHSIRQNLFCMKATKGEIIREEILDIENLVRVDNFNLLVTILYKIGSNQTLKEKNHN